MAVSKKVEYDFESFDDAALEAAIADAGASSRVKFIVVEGRFVGRFPDGEILEVPLKVSADDVERLTVEHASPVEQLYELLRLFGTEAQVKGLRKRNLAEVMSFSNSYFDVFGRVNAAALGE